MRGGLGFRLLAGRRNLPLFQPACCIRQGLVDIFLLKIGVGCQDLFGCPAGRQEAYDGSNRYAQAPNACFAAHDGGVECNARECFHDLLLCLCAMRAAPQSLLYVVIVSL